MTKILKDLKDFNGRKYHKGNTIKRLLKQGGYKRCPNLNYIKNIATGEYLHYNRILKITIIE